MPHFRILSIALSALALAACATATPYQALKDGQGYSEQKLQSNRYRVTFAGNSLTSRQTVENYLLYRSAEIALAGGYDWFETSDRNTEAETRYSESISGFGGFGYRWAPVGLGVGVGTATPITQYEAQAEIILLHDKPADGKTFNAREIKENLGALIQRPGS